MLQNTKADLIKKKSMNFEKKTPNNSINFPQQFIAFKFKNALIPK